MPVARCCVLVAGSIAMVEKYKAGSVRRSVRAGSMKRSTIPGCMRRASLNSSGQRRQNLDCCDTTRFRFSWPTMRIRAIEPTPEYSFGTASGRSARIAHRNRPVCAIRGGSHPGAGFRRLDARRHRQCQGIAGNASIHSAPPSGRCARQRVAAQLTNPNRAAPTLPPAADPARRSLPPRRRATKSPRPIRPPSRSRSWRSSR